MATENPQNDTERETLTGSAPQQQADDRRSEVNPAENPVPSSPEPDAEALRQGEETLERVKPY